jgi:hypothetical protein
LDDYQKQLIDALTTVANGGDGEEAFRMYHVSREKLLAKNWSFDESP